MIVRRCPCADKIGRKRSPAGIAGGAIRLSSWKKIVGVNFQHIPCDADSGVVTVKRFPQNLTALIVGEIRADFRHVVDMPRDLDGIGKARNALGAATGGH
jgi:hypothetical protein